MDSVSILEMSDVTNDSFASSDVMFVEDDDNVTSTSTYTDKSQSVIDENICERLVTLQQRERKHMVDPGYWTECQPLLSLQNRQEVVSWMIELCDRLELSHLTVSIAVNLLDRFLSKRKILASGLRAIAAGALLIAAKLNERAAYVPAIDFLSWSAGTEMNLVKASEGVILQELRWDVNALTAHAILPLIVELNFPHVNQKDELQQLVSLFLEISLLDIRFLSFSPSIIAYSCLRTVNSVKFFNESVDSLAPDQQTQELVNLCSQLMQECFRAIFSEDALER
uniref:Cyclin-like domain-containing protein n=1 Tax=Timspurckia oligopyrenoides TaxID=708627 RepID=A0A7S0ZAJ6_9RHOD|mmetsp:Transcript_10193/g.18354  ORF Transcript_10193/g.18354 Transcript_10193/m.18354 type:complete len:282 (+) Transcript_10193:331-1176(+)|eukprot:CAMPEP_0182441200 /NCGR_PEP_ID=MMETSP1172-20130603/143_1 /TAXON_ID=708627 /ORGANISM="Timspurckia oligopyrenoides, Strain CCMP3278" /LENGTH=281 /DNA_ID=CAMNT_0024635367 /DNA_START=265 /DNA_END=1110 /DNA_ORIENTATION=+